MILHAVGIPLTVAAAVLLVLAIGRDSGWWYLSAGGAVVLGYALQFIGHAVEGNDAGEIILIKRLLGRPYKAVADDVQMPSRPFKKGDRP